VARLRGLEGPGAVLYAGYSPWEGHWGRALKEARADVFVTAKYEAWPELWASLSELDVPLLIVGAKARRSLKLAGALCKILGGAVPKLTLLTAREEDSAELASLFAGYRGVAVHCTGEPRWDRVQARARTGSPRARELIERFARLPRPWGVLAQVWSEDMEVWRGQLGPRNGTLWVVPHRVDAEHVAKVEAYLFQAGLKTRKSSSAGADPEDLDAVLVDEMGVLLELYSAADWVYVGGGFGVSMHSTIEPALYGIPIACGPHGETKFPEIAELRQSGQLAVVRDHEELSAWLEGLRALSPDARQSWKKQATGRLGATDRVLGEIRKACTGASKS
jgi:3-deoxy-D-manno-octulosonic-acid transferase